MSKNKVVHFEIPASDFKKSREFYEKIFDWTFEMWGDDSAMTYTTDVDSENNPSEPGGINGGFYKRQSEDQQPSIIVETPSIDETLRIVDEAGGTVTRAKHGNAEEWGFMAEFKDPEGNEITLWEKGKK